ncbi:MAG: hypothetical protein WBG29_11365, partial [Candidatus Acidiferrales bacterium]
SSSSAQYDAAPQGESNQPVSFDFIAVPLTTCSKTLPCPKTLFLEGPESWRNACPKVRVRRLKKNCFWAPCEPHLSSLRQSWAWLVGVAADI